MGANDVEIHALVIDGSEWSASRPCCFTTFNPPGKKKDKRAKQMIFFAME
jgi:hypothetical protein